MTRRRSQAIKGRDGKITTNISLDALTGPSQTASPSVRTPGRSRSCVSETHPEIVDAFFADPSDGHRYVAGSTKSIRCRCAACGHEWQKAIREIVQVANPCPACRGDVAIPGKTDVATTHPGVVATYFKDPLDGQLYTAGSKKRILGRCIECGYEGTEEEPWMPWICNLTRGKQGCPRCYGERRSASQIANLVDKRGCVARSHPDVVAAYFRNPEDGYRYTAGSGQRIPARCAECGYEGTEEEPWMPWICNLTAGKQGCPVCGSRRGADKKRATHVERYGSVAQTHPEIVAAFFKDHGQGLLYTGGSHAHVDGLCANCGFSGDERGPWRPRISNLVYLEQGCPECNGRGGFNPARAGGVYLIDGNLSGRSVAQYGISNKPRVRLKRHASTGFRGAPVRLIMFRIGKDAAGLERQITNLRKSFGVRTCTQEGFVFDGSTESFFIDYEEGRALFEGIMALMDGVPEAEEA